jgi:hypothetical protein
MMVLCLILSFSLITDVNSKTLYKWTDINGKIHITDTPPLPGEAVKLDKIEYEETKEEERQHVAEGSCASYSRDLLSIIDIYRHDKSAQSRYLKDVAISRYFSLSLSDIIGPEFSMLENTFGLLGPSIVVTFLSFVILLHLFFSFCFYRIIFRTGVTNAKLVWIPVINIFPLIQASGKPIWWGMLLIIPLAGIFPPFVVNGFVQSIFVIVFFAGAILFTLVWMSICNRIGLNKWAGSLILVPFIQLMLPAYLAFSKHSHPDRSKHIKSVSKEHYIHLLASSNIGFEIGSISTSRGPVAIKLERFIKGKDYPHLKLRVRLVHLPNFILEAKLFGKLAIKAVLNTKGDNLHYKEHYLEKKTDNKLEFKENLRPFFHFETLRDVWLLKGVSIKDIKIIKGEFFLRLPLNIQSFDFNINDREREEFTNTSVVKLKEMSNNHVSLQLKGSIRNYITTLSYTSRGRPLLSEGRSCDQLDHNNYVIKEDIKGRVSRIKVFIADGFLEERYPFQLKL